MGRTKVPLLLVIATVVQFGDSYIESLAANHIVHTSDSRNYEPMVAFLCNKPSMVRVPSGWVKDERQNCTRDSKEILTYCKKRYPNHDVTNVVRSNFPVTINNWCKVGKDNCHRHGNHTVLPFRCLVGPFQSSALLVPQHCIFDHYHDSKVCEAEGRWNLTSIERCDMKAMVRQSYDILLPCKTVGLFSGVEYVCCPRQTEPHVSISVHIDHVKSAPKIVLPELASTGETAERPYMRYLKEESLNLKQTEHENYETARKDWQRYHHDKITDMMKLWSDARDRNVLLKATDPDRAAKENSEIQHKFEKMYHALEEQGLAEKAQLNSIHQNHVQRSFNEKKRTSMQRYMDELQRDEPQATKLLQALERYLRVEEKDRRHAVNRYEHLRDANPTEARRILTDTINHLRWIDTRISQSIKMLHRFPDVEAEVKPHIVKFLRRFRGIEASARAIVQPDDQKKVVEEERARQTTTTSTSVPEVTTKQVEETTLPPPHVEMKAPVIEEVIIESHGKDEDDMEDERNYVRVEEKKEFIAHQTDSRIQQLEISVHREVSASAQAGGMYGATAGIAIGSVSVFVIVIVAIVKLRRQRSRKPTITHGFVEVDQVTPEERHVVNMQINGYENPTYKYFEK